MIVVEATSSIDLFHELYWFLITCSETCAKQDAWLVQTSFTDSILDRDIIMQCTKLAGVCPIESALLVLDLCWILVSNIVELDIPL